MKIFNNNTLENLIAQDNFLPFDDIVLNFIKQFSKSLLSLRNYPDIVSLGFYFRNIQYRHNNRPRGIVLHIAPSNVNTIFIYSLFISMLCGNRNIVKLPRKITAEVQILIDKLNECTNEEINKRLLICNYEHDEKITSQLCNVCNVRVIWGGDETVNYFRKNHPLKPLSTEVVFPNRFSFAVIKMESLENIEVLAKKFYNDAFLFSQQACSSPKVIFWVGEKNENYKKFWECVRKEAVIFDNNATMVQDRFVSAVEIASSGQNIKGKIDEFPVVIECCDLEMIREHHCGNGMFFEMFVNELEDVLKYTADKDQTMIAAGFSKEELNVFVGKIKNRGIDRIVGFGQALEFNHIWDGMNLYDVFSRMVSVL